MAKPGRKPTLTKAQTLAGIRGSGGIMINVARRLKRDRNTAYKYVHMWPETEEAFRSEREAMIDMAEQQLTKQVRGGDPWAVKFTLATLGKSRGYTERHELTGAEGERIELDVRFVEPERSDD